MSLLRSIRAASLVLLAAMPAAAGSLCGTVRDASTSGAVSNAGVFLRQAGGAYTGRHAATDAVGAFCIHFVPPGTYDLEILIDDYRVAYLRNIAVTGDVTDVPVSVAGSGLLLRRPVPSPAETRVTISWVMPSPAGARLMVFDAQGRLRSAWESEALSAGNQSVDWDLRDSRGARIPAGVYYIRLESGAERRVRRFVCLP